MENFIKADIFFFITSVVVAIFAIGMIIVAVYVVRILSDMKHISKTILRESERFAHDIDSLRDGVKLEGAKIKMIVDFFLGLFMRRRKKSDNKKD